MIETTPTTPIAPRPLSAEQEMEAAFAAGFANVSHRAAWALYDFLLGDLALWDPVIMENELRRRGVPLGKTRPKR